jgi:hypothetical protein
MNIASKMNSFINPYGVLITIVEGATRAIYARAVYCSKDMDDVELRSDLSEERLKKLSVNDVYMMANGMR